MTIHEQLRARCRGRIPPAHLDAVLSAAFAASYAA
jgi:hypothetical protein